VSKDTLVVRKGESISEQLASVLSKLGVKPVEAGLSMKVVYDDGLIIMQEQLRIDINETRQTVERAYADSFALSLSIAYPTKENAPALLQTAHREAYVLSISTAIPSKETIEDLVRKAHAEMLSLSSRLPTLEEKTVQTETSEKS
jgi:large subunit ribosomal protein L10